MLVCPAEGCSYKAKTDRSIGLHIRTCKFAATALVLIAEDAKEREDGLRHTKRRRILSPERTERDLDDEEVVHVDQVCTTNINMKLLSEGRLSE